MNKNLISKQTNNNCNKQRPEKVNELIKEIKGWMNNFISKQKQTNKSTIVINLKKKWIHE